MTPSIDWQAFLSICNGALAKMPTEQLDSYKVPLNAASFIAALSYLRSPESKETPWQSLLKSGLLKEHLSFSFLIVCDREVLVDVTTRSKLNIVFQRTINENYLIVASGTLNDWYNATLEFCTKTVCFGTRYLYDAITLLFEKAGFQQLWTDCAKESLTDGTFLLENKNVQ